MAKQLPRLYVEGYTDAQQRIACNIEWDIRNKQRLIVNALAADKSRLQCEIEALKFALGAIQIHKPSIGEREEAREEDERRAQRALRKITGQVE